MAVSSLFNAEWYLINNPDVRAAVETGLVDAEMHFQEHGRFEGRSPSHTFDPAYYLAKNPDVKAAVDEGMGTAYDHFLLHGMAEARAFVPYFDVKYYLQNNADVREAVGNDPAMALTHFLLYGQGEARAISPFFDLRAYLDANPDVKSAVKETGASALEHLLTHGISEGRPLGNGVSLEQFSNDPVFQNAANAVEALARVAEVAPFLPTFQAPAGWQPPANTPIPEGFVPVEGEKLVVPPTVEVPDGTELPDAFEPEAPAPEPGPGPGPGEGDTTPTTFQVNFDPETGILTFDGNARGDISLTIDGATATFVRGANKVVIDDFELKGVRLSLTDKETLVVPAEYLSDLKTTGTGVIKVELSDISEADSYSLEGDSEANNINNLALKLTNAVVNLPGSVENNVLVYPDRPHWDENLGKSLHIEAQGDSHLYLGNSKSADVGYYLKDIQVEGNGSLYLSTLYFGKEGTQFSSAAYEGDLILDAYIYNGTDREFDWKIELGSGKNYVRLNEDGTGNFPGRFGSQMIAEAGDSDTLAMSANVYKQWSTPSTWDPESGKVSGFEQLHVAASDGESYQSTLLGNQFESLYVYGSLKENISVEAGFDLVILQDVGSADVSALKGGEAWIQVRDVAPGETLSLKLAEIDKEKNNKSDLDRDDGVKSDFGVALNAIAAEGSTIVIENMTIGATAAYTEELITNDRLFLQGLDSITENNLLSFTVERGENRTNEGNSDWYVDFTMELDIDGDIGTDDVVTIVLENIVARGVYNKMLQALDTVKSADLENTLQLIGWDGEWVENGTLFNEYKFDMVTESREFDGEHAIELVGLLVNEGNIAFMPIV